MKLSLILLGILILFIGIYYKKPISKTITDELRMTASPFGEVSAIAVLDGDKVIMEKTFKIPLKINVSSIRLKVISAE